MLLGALSHPYSPFSRLSNSSIRFHYSLNYAKLQIFHQSLCFVSCFEIYFFVLIIQLINVQGAKAYSDMESLSPKRSFLSRRQSPHWKEQLPDSFGLNLNLYRQFWNFSSWLMMKANSKHLRSISIFHLHISGDRLLISSAALPVLCRQPYSSSPFAHFLDLRTFLIFVVPRRASANLAS